MAQNTYRLTIAYNVAGQFATNSFHWQFDDSGYTTSQLAAKALIDRWIAVKLTHLQNLLSSSVTILSAKARKVTGVGGFESLEFAAPGTVGALSGTLMVSAVGPVIICYPTNNGKMRGRVFLPGVPDSVCVNGQLTVTFVTGTQTDVNALFTSMVLAGGGTPTAESVIFRSKVPQTSTLIEQTKFSDTVGTIRRRQVPA